jgi:predicted phage tail protein
MTAIAIRLHGDLARFGGPFHLHVDTVGEAVRALCTQLRGLRAAIAAGSFRVIRGPQGSGLVMGEADLPMRLGRARELHVVPVPHGRGRGAGKIILGAVLIAAAFVFAPAAAAGAGFLGANLGATAIAGLGITYGNIAMFGVSMLFSGIAQMMSPTPKAPKPFEPADRRPSFLFEQPVNVSSQGSVIPLVYGRFRVGSVVVSASLETEDYAAGQGSEDVPTIGDGKTGVLRWFVAK